ncbi:MAG: T9SS type A sorting domain-containing protein [Bacteroidia bacterium]
MSSSNFGTSQTASGKLTFSWLDGTFAGQNMANNAPLFTIMFNLTGTAGSQTILNFATSPTPLEVSDSLMNVLPVTTVNGKIKIAGSASAQTLKVRMDTVSGPNSAQVVVPVRVWRFHGILSAQGTISFNTAVATYVATEQYGLNGMTAGNFGTSQVSSGKLMFSWSDANLIGANLADSSVIFAIRFNIVGLPGDTTRLNFINSPTPVEFIDSTFNTVSPTLVPGKIRVSGNVSITTNNPTAFTYCAGDPLSISYTALGAFNAGNLFILQLSGPTGSFASPTNVDTISGTSLSGTFITTIPISATNGTGYRFRVVSTNSAITGTNNGTNVTINQIPAIPATPTGTAALCTNPVNTTYTISAVAGATSYSWTIIPAGAGTLTPSGTSAVVDWNNTYNGTAHVFVSASNGTCQSAISDSIDITVYAIPSTPLKPFGDSALCASSSNSTYTISPVSNAVTYQWQLTPAAAGTITGTGTSAVVNWNGAFSGTASVSVAGANPNCTGPYSVVRSVSVLLSPVPPTYLSGNLSLCLNPANTTYIVSSAANATSTIWSLTTPGAGVLTPTDTTAIVNWTNTFTGPAHIKFTASNGTCSASDSITVNINTPPAATSAVSGLTTLCNGVSATYSVTNDPNISSYSWTFPGGWTGTSTTNSITAVAGTSGTISLVATNNCGSTAPATLAVTVNNIPAVPGTISGTTTICSGTTNSYSVVPVAGATSYAWTLPGGWTGTSATNSIAATSNASSGNITVTAGNTCGNSTTQTSAITVNVIPASPGTISGSAVICSGTTTTYSVAAVSGATAYAWALPGGWTGTSTTNSITATASSATGNITVTANNSCGSSAVQSLAITVNTIPASPGAISGAATVCAGSNTIYSITPVAGASGYTWALPGGWSGTSTTNTITTTAGNANGNITVTADNSCGSSAVQTLAVSVTTIPAAPGAITGNAAICSGTSNTYSIAAVSGATAYTWTFPGGWTGSSATNSIIATASDTSGNVSVTADNFCGSSPAQIVAVVVTAIPATPGTISGPAGICSGNNATYSISAVPGATSYAWTLPGGWPGTSITNSITTTAVASGGNISVTAANSCGVSSPQTFSVVVNAGPATPGPISGSTTVCSGSSNVFSVAAVAGAVSYTWTLPGGWTGTSTTDSITATASSTGGTISVSVNNGCGSGGSQSITVGINTVPASPGIISGVTTLCSGSNTIYSISLVPGATGYTWGLPGGWSGTSSTDSITAVASDTSGIITVTADNVCGSSTVQTLAVTVNVVPAVPGTISGLSAICTGTSTIYSVVAVAGATGYTWGLPGGWSGTSVTDSITITAGNTSGAIIVTADNSCGSSAGQILAVTVDTIAPTAGPITGATTICSGSSGTWSVTAIAGASSYTWTLPGGWSGTSIADSITAIASDTSGTISVSAGNSCGNGALQAITVSVNLLPAVSYSQSPSIVCVNNTSLPLTGASPAGGIFSGTAVTSGTFDASVAGLGSFVITYSYTDANTCTNTAASTITVDPCTGIQQAFSESEILLYPNPVVSIVTLSGIEMLAQLTVYNAIGKVVLTQRITEDKTEIDLSKETNELYFFKIVTANKTVIKRVVKQ